MMVELQGLLVNRHPLYCHLVCKCNKMKMIWIKALKEKFFRYKMKIHDYELY